MLFLAIVANAPVFAQQAVIRQADKHFAAHNFTKAAFLWQKAFERALDVNDKRYLAFRIGSAFHRMNRFEEALQWYDDALGEESSNTDWILAQADAALRSGKISMAKASAESVLKLNPVSAEAKHILSMIAQFEEHEKAPGIEVFLATGINTEWSDYAPVWFNGDLIVSSSRPSAEGAATDGRTSENYSSLFLFIANLYGDFGKPISLPVSKNTNAGALSFDPLQQRVFYTKCNNRKRKCTIMESKFDPVTFMFTMAKPVSFANRKYHYGHPFVTDNGRKMYFSARIPGGYGGNDIYSISIKPDGSWGVPINLGPDVNTPFDELFPTSAGDSLLFFSSAGHLGFGGLDIFYAFDNGSGFDPIKILPFPFNSTSDDFALSMKPGTSTGAFSSNRNRESGDDVFFFDGYPIRKLVGGTIADESTLQPVEGAMVTLKDSQNGEMKSITLKEGTYLFSVPDYATGSVSIEHPEFKSERKEFTSNKLTTKIQLDFLLQRSNYEVGISGLVTERETRRLMEGKTITISGQNGFLAMTKTNKDGIYVFDSLTPEQMYTIKISADGYFSESRVVRIPIVDHSIVLKKSNGYDVDFELTQIAVKREIVLNNIYYDFDKATLRETSKIELGKLVSMLKETPKVRIQISAHTDSRGTNAYNDRLSKERAQAVVNYLVSSGISPGRLVAKGYGKRNLIVKNAQSETDHQANRRTTFQVIDLNAPVEEIFEVADEGTIRLVYRVQILVSTTRFDPDTYFEPLKKTVNRIKFYTREQEIVFRYEAGDRYSLAEAEALRNQIRSAGFDDAFIVPYIDGKRVSIQQARDFKP